MKFERSRNAPRVLVGEGPPFCLSEERNLAETKHQELHELKKPAGVMMRQLARRDWSVSCNSDCSKPLMDSPMAEPGQQEQQGLPNSADFEGHRPEDLKEAVAAASSSLDAEELHEASTVLRDVASLVQEEGCLQLMRLDAVPALLRLLTSSDLALQEDAAATLLSMLKHRQTRSLLISQGIAMPLVRALCHVALPSTRASIATCLSFLINSDTQAILLKSSGALTVLVDMLRVAQQEASVAAITPRTPPGVVAFPRLSSKCIRATASDDDNKYFRPSVESSADNGVHDACQALMHVSRFGCVKRELLKLGVVPLLAEVAKVAPLINSERSVAGLFHVLSISEEGAGAICLDNEGAGARALFTLAQQATETAQVLALEALICVARRKGQYVEQMRRMGFYESLWEVEDFKNPCSESLREKVLMLKHLLLQQKQNSGASPKGH